MKHQFTLGRPGRERERTDIHNGRSIMEMIAFPEPGEYLAYITELTRRSRPDMRRRYPRSDRDDALDAMQEADPTQPEPSV